MLKSPAHLLVASLAIGIAFTAPIGEALAQPEKSPNELRVENDRLRETIDRLRADNERLKQEIASQEELIAQLRARLREVSERRSSPAAPADAPGDDASSEPARETAATPDDPLASPESMLRHLTSQYTAEFGADAPSSDAESERRLQDVRAWSRAAARETRGLIEWRVRIVSIADSGGGVEIEVDVIDENSGLPIGDAFTMQVVGRNAARIRSEGEGAVWIVDGRLRGDIRVDEGTLSPMDVADGLFIGPFAIFEFEVQIRALRDTP